VQDDATLGGHEGLGHILQLVVKALLGKDLHDILIGAIEDAHYLAFLGDHQIASKNSTIQVHGVVLEGAHEVVADQVPHQQHDATIEDEHMVAILDIDAEQPVPVF